MAGSYFEGYIDNGYSQGPAARENEVVRMENDSPYQTSCNIPDYPIDARNVRAVATDQGIVVCGGHGGPAQATCYQLSSTSSGWTSIAPMKQRRTGFAMVEVGGDIYAFGTNENMKAEVFRDSQWSFIKDMPREVHVPCGVKLDDNTIMSIGGKDGSTVRNVFSGSLILYIVNVACAKEL